MSEKSRVKRYEDLRKDIVSNPEGDEISDSTKRKVLDHVTSPSNEELQQEAPRAKQSKVEDSSDSFVSALMSDSIDAEQNEYFDDFIDEVRQYNIDKGTKSDYNTQIDILRQLKETSEQRKRYVEEIPEDSEEDLDEVYTSTLSSEEIAQQVRSLIFESDDNDEEETQEVVETKKISKKEARAAKREQQEEELIIVPQEERDLMNETIEDAEMTLQIQLLEETQQLKKQVSDYEGELNNLSEDLSKNNKLINKILLFLIFILIGCVLFFSYVLLTKVGVL